ncbi:hypothetical protein RchiOBHm_Chr3g0479671 [Rosa chinensis]|uniref:Uncharacterized protein n=1 Tax=Rosa chinensis TaxID=74649 RepID=A0A2P6RDJ5_ROSCH|nr:hypothetical protein RchiOBHm_Chr3g0479671 [Rosa chinensis]
MLFSKKEDCKGERRRRRHMRSVRHSQGGLAWLSCHSIHYFRSIPKHGREPFMIEAQLKPH